MSTKNRRRSTDLELTGINVAITIIKKRVISPKISFFCSICTRYVGNAGSESEQDIQSVFSDDRSHKKTSSPASVQSFVIRSRYEKLSDAGGSRCLSLLKQLARFLVEAFKASVVRWKEFWFSEKKKSTLLLFFCGQIHQIKGKYERALLSLESAISDLLFGRNRVFLQNIWWKLNLSSFSPNK